MFKGVNIFVAAVVLAFCNPAAAVKFGVSLSQVTGDHDFESTSDSDVDEGFLRDEGFAVELDLTEIAFTLLTGDDSRVFSYKLDVGYASGDAEPSARGVDFRQNDISGLRINNGFRFRLFGANGFKLSLGPDIALGFLKNDFGGASNDTKVFEFGLGPVLSVEQDFGGFTGVFDLAYRYSGLFESDDDESFAYFGDQFTARLSFAFGG